MKFAALHRKPLKQGTFTFCENIRPSRLDFGKQRYGGPYTTEQVEDVRVMLNILKILFALGPVFLVEATAFASYYKYRGSSIEGHEGSATSTVVHMLVNN